LRINGSIKGSEIQLRGTLYNRLAFAIQRKSALMALVSSELFSSSDQGQFFTISNENSALTRRNKDSAIGAVIYVQISSDVKNKIRASVTVVYVILLFFDRIYLFYFKSIVFIFESVIIRIELFLYSFRFENVC